MKSKLKIMYLAGLAVCVWLLVFAADYAQVYQKHGHIPANTVEHEAYTTGIVLLCTGVMFFLIWCQWEWYRKNIWNGWSVEKLLLVLVGFVLLGEIVRQLIMVPFMGSSRTDIWLKIAPLQLSVTYPRFITYWLIINVFYPVSLILSAKVWTRTYGKNRFLCFSLWNILLSSLAYIQLERCWDGDVVRTLFAGGVIFLTYVYCSYVYFFRGYIVNGKRWAFNSIAMGIGMFCVGAFMAGTHISYFWERVGGFYRGEQIYGYTGHLVRELMLEASFAGPMRRVPVFLDDWLINTYAANPIWVLLKEYGWLAAIGYLCVTAAAIWLVIRLCKGIQGSGLRVYVFCSACMLVVRWGAGLAMSFSLLPIQKTFSLMPFCGAYGLYDVCLLGTCLLGCAVKQKSKRHSLAPKCKLGSLIDHRKGGEYDGTAFTDGDI